MIEVVTNSITVVFLSLGVFFLSIGVIGIIRLPDIYSRLHASTKCDIFGAGLALLGLVVYEGVSFNALKLLVITGLMLTSGLVIGHAVARAARRGGLTPWQEDREELIRLEKEKLLEKFMEEK
ncbi:MAG: monovalent cation/H(+) antiporter subunit G [Actinomycetota bacterium]|nr:monovalent cation/H(+) antiporter subunit G [Actinomycetota bacterium]